MLDTKFALPIMEKLLKNKILIGYNPLKDEVDYESTILGTGLQGVKPKKHFTVSNKKCHDPFLMAALFSEKFDKKDVTVFIPGKKFDAHGTRHGHGNGWYDRFLSKIPTHWHRVGVAHASQFYNSKLARQTWDQPVDWVIVCGGSSCILHKTFARHSDVTEDTKDGFLLL